MKILKLSSKWVPEVEVMLDDEDYERASDIKWKIQTNGDCVYFNGQIKIQEKWKQVRLHRFILEYYGSEYEIDHVDNDGRNNQKSNLRLVTKSQNSRNRKTWGESKFTGVHKYKDKWKANINNPQGVQQYIGVFDEEWHAALAYNIMSKHYFGEDGVRNKFELKPGVDKLPFGNFFQLENYLERRRFENLSSQYTKEKNITWDKNRESWVVKYKWKGKQVNVGRYTELSDAIIARNKSRHLICGEPLPTHPHVEEPVN